MISAGAKVLGSFTIGENSKIGAGSVVLEEVPPNSTVVGVPGRVVKRGNQPIPRDTMDQVNLPDPVKEDISNLQHANSELINRLLDLEAEVRYLKRTEEKECEYGECCFRQECRKKERCHETLKCCKKGAGDVSCPAPEQAEE